MLRAMRVIRVFEAIGKGTEVECPSQRRQQASDAPGGQTTGSICLASQKDARLRRDDAGDVTRGARFGDAGAWGQSKFPGGMPPRHWEAPGESQLWHDGCVFVAS